MGPKKCRVQKKFWVQKILGPKYFLDPTEILDPKINLGCRKTLGQRNGTCRRDFNFHCEFIQETFVLATFVHIRNISAVTDPILMKLYRYVPLTIFNECQRQLSRATYVLARCVQVSNISAVADPILNKCFGPDFLGAIIFLGTNLFLDQSSFDPNISWAKQFC